MDTNIIIFFIDILVMYAVLYAHQETNESLESLFFTGTKSGTPRFFNVLLQMVILNAARLAQCTRKSLY